jgi:large subunit ribosomal protein L4
MAQIEVRNWNNEVVKTVELSPAVFDYPYKQHLVYEAVLAYRAAARAGTHKTKNRVEVSGGTRKLWKQKHTGRARMGDNRSPLWRHGGTVHGPRPRDYAWKLPRRMRRNAIRSALAQLHRDGRLFCVESFNLDTHKTKLLDEALRGRLGLERKTLLLPEASERNLELAARNNERLRVVAAMGVSVVDLVGHDAVVISEQALQQLSEVLAR